MRGWLSELMISTFWFALIYFGRHEVERVIGSFFADVVRVFGMF